MLQINTGNIKCRYLYPPNHQYSSTIDPPPPPLFFFICLLLQLAHISMMSHTGTICNDIFCEPLHSYSPLINEHFLREFAEYEFDGQHISMLQMWLQPGRGPPDFSMNDFVMRHRHVEWIVEGWRQCIETRHTRFLFYKREKARRNVQVTRQGYVGWQVHFPPGPREEKIAALYGGFAMIPDTRYRVNTRDYPPYYSSLRAARLSLEIERISTSLFQAEPYPVWRKFITSTAEPPLPPPAVEGSINHSYYFFCPPQTNP